MKTERMFTMLAWTGVALIIIAAFFVRLMRMSMVDTRSDTVPSGVAVDQNIPSDEPLGELNSHCGGPLRLPCRPGLLCSVDAQETELLGTCVRGDQSAATYAQMGEACDRARLCVAGLLCASGTCSVFHDGAPKIMSLAPEGMQFTNGVYQSKSGTKVPVHIVAVNTISARLFLRNVNGTREDLGALKASEGGSYAGSFTMPPGFVGALEVIAEGASGVFSSLVTAVQTTD